MREPTRPAKALGRAWQSRPAGSTARGPNRRAAPALMLPATTITTACNLSAHLASYLVLVEGKVPSIISSTHCKIHHGQSLCVHVAYAYPSLLSGARRPRDCTHKSPTCSLPSVLQQITSRSWRSHANRSAHHSSCFFCVHHAHMLEISGVLLREGSNLRVELHCLAPVSMIFIVALSLVLSSVASVHNLRNLFNSHRGSYHSHRLDRYATACYTCTLCCILYTALGRATLSVSTVEKGIKKLLRG